MPSRVLTLVPLGAGAEASGRRPKARASSGEQIATSRIAARQLHRWVNTPATTVAAAVPTAPAASTLATVRCRWAKGSRSPTYATITGSSAAADAPASARPRMSTPRLGASADTRSATHMANRAARMTRTRPYTSEMRPCTGCIRPNSSR